jgi:ABC-type lipoprotein release transport system permease subunit
VGRIRLAAPVSARVHLTVRLAARDLRRRPGQALLLLLAITAATATLTLGLALNGVTSHPYQQTRAATNGPDVVAEFAPPPQIQTPGKPAQPGIITTAMLDAGVKQLISSAGVTGHTGPYPLASAILRAGRIAIMVEAEGRPQGPVAIDQPKLTAGHWVGRGGVVLERTFAAALGVGAGDHVTLDGRSFLVTGIAVTAAAVPYPNLCYTTCAFTGSIGSSVHLASRNVGLAWVTEAAARSLSSRQAPLNYVLNLRLKNPAMANAFVNSYRYSGNTSVANLSSWQNISNYDGLLVQDEQSVLEPGALLAGLLAIASVAVLAAGRMAERTRRVGLLKAVGGTPDLVAAVLLAENLVLAVAAAGAGLFIGWLAAPLITDPGAGLVGTPGPPSLTPATVWLAVAAALMVALAATLVPAVRAARSSTVSALANSARPPRRRPRLIALSARMPVAVLLGLRMAARRLRRAVLGAGSVAVTTMGITAVLAFHSTVNGDIAGLARTRLGDPVITRDSQMLVVITIVVLTLAVLNAVFTAWATVLDSRRPAALARALGASPQQVSAAVAWAQVLPAVLGVLAGVPLGLGLFEAANHGGRLTVPPVWWLTLAALGILVGVAVLASIPAQVGARHPVTRALEAETA